MDIVFLDSGFTICGIIDDYRSMKWNRRYFSCGDFSIDLPGTYYKVPAEARYVYHPGSNECGIIEKRFFSTGKDGARHLTLSGRLTEALLTDRVIDSVRILSGNLETQVISLVSEFAASGSRAIPMLTTAAPSGFSETVNAQAYAVDLSSFLYSLLYGYGMSYRLNYDYENGVLVFGLVKGLDRTQEQTDNLPAVFSSGFENILESLSTVDESKCRNFAYVFGHDIDGSGRPKTEVDRIAAGDMRRELAVPASDVSWTYRSGGQTIRLTEEEYAAMLTARGTEKLAALRPSVRIEGIIDSRSGPVYRRDFDLGDLCCCEEPEAGISHSLRLTEVTELWQNGVCDVRAVFTS